MRSIAILTFALLALELALIRWTSSQVRVLAYFNNLVLICAFAGIGIGAMSRRAHLLHAALPALAVFTVPFAFAEQLGIMHLRFPDPAVFLWGAERSAASAAQLGGAIVVIVLIAAGCMLVLALPAAALGAMFQERRGDPRAYTADLVGSLLGVLAFAACTALSATPPVWFALAVVPLAYLSRRPLSIVAGVVIIAAALSSVDGARFSPYNRIDVAQDGPTRIKVSVNRDYHQVMHDLRPSALPAHPPQQPPDTAADEHRLIRDVYELPFALSARGGHKDSAIIVGAGTGNDVAAALRRGFAHVESVDIDGRLIELGATMHPERPYDDARVLPVVDDARAYFARRDGAPVDVVVFGYVDSHAMFSSLSSLRLDNYLYTVEGLRDAWSHVAPHGHMTVCMSLLAGPWLAERLYATLGEATGATPVFVQHDLHFGGTFIVGKPGSAFVVDGTQALGELGFPKAIISTPDALLHVARTHDDWPFLYLQPGKVPWVYPFILVMVLVLTLVGVRVSAGRGAFASFDAPLFLMGAAFLLLETRAVTAVSVLFGSTWIVNAAVFAGVLVAAIAANLVVQWRGARAVPLSAAFVVLAIAVLVVWFVDTASLAALPALPRAIVAGLLHGLPIGVAGLIVSTLLVRAHSLAVGFASNLLGAVLGGASSTSRCSSGCARSRCSRCCSTSSLRCS